MLVPSLKSKQSGSALMIVVVVLVLAAIAGAGAYVATDGFKSDDSGQNKQNDTANFKASKASTAADITAMFAAVKAGDYDAKCTMHSSGTTDKNVITFTGDATYYVSGSNKFLMDATINKQSSHLLRLGNTLYIWADGKDKGSKFPITDEKKSSPNTFADNAEKFDMKCQSVTKLNDSFFMLPTDVTFVDINSQLQTQTYESN